VKKAEDMPRETESIGRAFSLLCDLEVNVPLDRLDERYAHEEHNPVIQ
jgi:hypothetical protein